MPEPVQDLLGVVCASEEDGKDPHLEQWFVDFKIEDELLKSYGADAELDIRMLGAAVWMSFEGM